MTKEIITTDNNQKMSVYCKTCVCKSCEQLKRLEQENKELKERKDKYYQQTLDDEILINELSLEVDLRKKESDFYLEKLSNYRSALEEIRKIVTGNYEVLEPQTKKDIETKINECLGG